MTEYLHDPLTKILQGCKTLAEYNRVTEIISLFLDMTKHHTKKNYATLCHDLKGVKSVIAQDPLYIALREGKISGGLQYEQEIVNKMHCLDLHYQDRWKKSLKEIIDVIKTHNTNVASVEDFQKKNFIAYIITKYALSRESNSNILYPTQYGRIATDTNKRILKNIYIGGTIDMYFVLFLQPDLHSLELMPVKFIVQEDLKPSDIDLTIDAAYIHYKMGKI